MERFSVANCALFNAESLRILVGAWPQLQLLHLRGCQEVKSSCAGMIASLTKLRSLDLSETGIDNSALTVLANTDLMLEELLLSGLRIATRDVKPILLSNAASLTRLSLARTLVDDSITPLLAQLPKLSVLDLSSCTRLTDDAIAAFAQLHGPLTVLYFSWTSSQKLDVFRASRADVRTK
jgi:F-box/leucine-rich repeat protein 2/20